MEPNQQIHITARQTVINDLYSRVDFITLDRPLEFRQELLKGFQSTLTTKGEYINRPVITTTLMTTDMISVIYVRDAVHVNAISPDGKLKSMLLRSMSPEEAANPDVQTLSLLVGKYMVDIQQIVTAPATALPERVQPAAKRSEDAAAKPPRRKSTKAEAEPVVAEPVKAASEPQTAAADTDSDEQSMSSQDEQPMEATDEMWNQQPNVPQLNQTGDDSDSMPF